MSKHIMLRTILFFLCLFCSRGMVNNIKSGSFDEQVYGKDGVVLLYTHKTEEVLHHFTKVALTYENNTNIHFWHLNCDFAVEFCEGRTEIGDRELPVMLYSFRNELWQAVEVENYKEHAFEVFFKTKLNENCLNTRHLCSLKMNETLKMFEDKNHTEIKEKYLEIERNIKITEKEWENVMERIKSEFLQTRLKYQVKITDMDDELKVLGQLMEKIHNEQYEENKGEVQEIEINF